MEAKTTTNNNANREKMMKSKLSLVLLAGIFALTPASYALQYIFDVELSGANEVGGGDPDGWGEGTVTITPSTNEISWSFVANNILVPLTGAHIHNAPAGVNGGVVFSFNSMFSGTGHDPIAQDILAMPTDYYVNLHTQEHPAGAIRGQLGEGVAVPDTTSATLGASTLALVLLAGRRARASRC